MNEIVENVEKIYKDHGNKIKTLRHLMIMYWKEYDGVRINSQYISTQDFLHKVTSPKDIINAKFLLDAVKEAG